MKRLGHGQALGLMVLVTLLWSVAGVVTRHLQSASGFEVTFWRSAFNALALVLLLGAWRGPAALWDSLRTGGRALWVSGVCWCVMYTNFMMALSLTTVAHVLVTMALAPLFTALGAWLALGHRIALRTWVAIVLAGCGIAWMYGSQLSGAEPRQLWGSLVALGVPLAAAANWTLLQHLSHRPAMTGVAEPAPGASADQARRSQPGESGADDGAMLTAVLLGAVLSATLTLPLALPFQASLRDVALLAGLGVFQLAIPCLLAVVVARTLAAPEVSLLALLEVVFGVALAWWGAGEAPSVPVLGGGLLVLLALGGNEVLALRDRRRPSH